MAPEPPAHQLVPFRWPAAWESPALLATLTGSPINCVIFDGAPPALSIAARKFGLLSREWKEISPAPIHQIRWNTPDPVIAISEARWPHLKPATRSGGDQGISGPTGAPWIESNTWIIRLSAARAPDKALWLQFTPPPDIELPQQAYRLAIADVFAAGGRWMVELDTRLAAAVAAGNGEALRDWSAVKDTLVFFEKRRAWRTFPHQGPLGVISSFSGANEFMGTEFLNLAARRNMLYRVIDRSLVEAAVFKGLRALLWLDPERPPQQVVRQLTSFARNGGLLIVHRDASAPFEAGQRLDCSVSGYELRVLGKGWLAVPERVWEDPYWLAMDVHNLVSRRYDPVRMFNASSLWVHYSVPPNGTGGLVQLVNFTGRAATSVSLRIQLPHKNVVIHTLESGGPAPLKPEMVEGASEYYLPSFSVYAALEVSA